MRISRPQKAALVALLLGSLTTAGWADSPPQALVGRVTTSATPLAQARVYAYQMSDLSLHRVNTDAIGSFGFSDLPAGLFKIIAIKAGFVPAVVLLTRETQETQQYLEVQLAPQVAGQADGKESFWSLRKKLPKDVLRDLETLEIAAANRQNDTSQADLLETQISAMTGTSDVGSGANDMSRGQMAMSGSLGASEFDLTGDYWLAREPRSTETAAHSAQLSLSLSNPNGSRVRLTTIDNEMNSRQQNYTDVDLSRYQVSWSQEIGRGSSQVNAEFVEQSNFYAAGALQPVGVPLASRSWNVEGNYSTPVRGQNSIQAGFRYRQREELDPALSRETPEQRVDLFGTGASRVASSVLVEYGLYSTLRDGSVSLVPRGGVVVDLGRSWTARTLASHKVHEDDNDLLADFMPVAFSNNGECQAEDFCYAMELAREWAGDQNLSFGAMHRRFGETLRLYFNDDFFNHFESLYLVDGDTLPELQFAMTNRLSPQILTRLESSVAAGGGGMLQTTDSQTFENNVRYLVTSLDTQFERTDTGLFLAFHHLEQELEPMLQGLQGSGLEMQRLQLMLTQDLSALNLASLVLRLNMELSRGGSLSDSSHDADELYKRVMGGVAVTF
jgi:hypothetical protein